MATLLDGPEILDHAGLERLIEHLIAGGVLTLSNEKLCSRFGTK
jgi:hypothetical protein